MKPTGMSAKVRERRERRQQENDREVAEREARLAMRKEARNHAWWRFGLMLVILCITTGSTIYSIHMQRKLHALMNAPTWANFTMVSDSVTYSSGYLAGGLPSHLTINGERWDLAEVKQFSDTFGLPDGPVHGTSRDAQTDCSHRLIAFIRDDDRTSLRITLMHEVYHAGGCLHGGDSWWNSEHPTLTVHPGIVHLSEFTTIFLRDNPAFAAWLVTQ